jgi:hypothetical protein
MKRPVGLYVSVQTVQTAGLDSAAYVRSPGSHVTTRRPALTRRVFLLVVQFARARRSQQPDRSTRRLSLRRWNAASSRDSLKRRAPVAAPLRHDLLGGRVASRAARSSSHTDRTHGTARAVVGNALTAHAKRATTSTTRSTPRADITWDLVRKKAEARAIPVSRVLTDEAHFISADGTVYVCGSDIGPNGPIVGKTNPYRAAGPPGDSKRRRRCSSRHRCPPG